MTEMKNAIVSATDKSGIDDFVVFLKKNGYKIYSTVGTWKFLNEKGIEVNEISEITGIPEMFGGRLKTLSSYVLGGILAVNRDDEELRKYKMVPIDLVMVSLYDFVGELRKGTKDLIDYIDIGGVTLLRAAAKNYNRVIVVPGNEYMKFVMERMRNGDISLDDKKYLASVAFHLTSYYDYAISNYFGEVKEFFNLSGKKSFDLRYGENPHQEASTYNFYEPFFKIMKEGKEISYNNILDAWNAWELVNRLFPESCVVVKHNTPCGAASTNNPLIRAYEGDEVSAYGGVIGCNYPMKEEDVEFLSSKFVEVVIYPDYEKDALEKLSKKKNLRILKGNNDYYKIKDIKTAGNIILVQDWNIRRELKYDVITGSIDEETKKDLIFGWEVSKSLRSNSAAIVENLSLMSIGSGQPNRVDAVEIALKKAKKLNRISKRSLLISDGFFPFKDSLELIENYGVKNVAAPMGSIRDNEIIEYAKNSGLNFIKVEERAFKH